MRPDGPAGSRTAVVAGHLCLDILPNLDHLLPGQYREILQPGRLLEIGQAVFSTGGAVSNTGLALNRLGIRTTLLGKVGDDLFGKAVRDIIESQAPGLSESLLCEPHASTSFTLILSPPATDRIFLFHPGVHDTFTAADIDYDCVAGVDLFHFGYPTLLKQMYQHGGVELARVLKLAKETGATTSLDTSFPDPSSESGRVDWVSILRLALPNTDLFLPSIEELLYSLRRNTYTRLLEQAGGGRLISLISPGLLSDLGAELLDMGVKVALIKLGERGLYLRTAGREALRELGRARPEHPETWARREAWAPGFQVQVAGTTGAGDAAIAGFLCALLKGLSPEEALTSGAAAGACCVEAPDALSGVPDWNALQRRIRSGWQRLPLAIDQPGWDWDSQRGAWIGPNDRQ